MIQASSRPRSLSLVDRLQPVLLTGAIGVGLLLAAGTPDLGRRLGWIVSAGVFLVIYLIMLGVKESDLLAAFRRLRPTAIALGVNFLLTPLVVWGLGFLFLQDQPEVWVGLILYLVTPCIGWYLVFTDLAEGDVELGISLLFWNILLQVSLLPLYMWALAGRIVPIDIGAILESVVLFLALPYGLAFATRRWLTAGGRDAAAMPGLGLGKTAALMAVIAAMFASQGEVLLENPGLVWRMIAPGAVFFAFTFALALLLGRLGRLTYREVALLTFTTTARNSEVSLALAATAFASPLVALTVVIGPAIELPVLILVLRALQAIRARGWYG